MILTKKQLIAITGYQRPSKQMELLKRYGVRFMVGADGHPRVLRIEVENRENKPLRVPNLEALRRLG